MTIQIIGYGDLCVSVEEERKAGPTDEQIHEEQVQKLCNHIVQEVKNGLLKGKEVIRIPLSASYNSAVQQSAREMLKAAGYSIDRYKDGGDVTWTFEANRQSN